MSKKISHFQFFWGVILILCTVGCSAPTAVNDTITAVIYENVAAMNAKDLARYMATIHPKSPAQAGMQTALQTLFDTYQLNTTISGVKVISVTAIEARVAFVLTTTKLKGPDFKDNRLTGEFILQKDGDAWKIFGQDIQKTEYLNQ